MGTEQDERFLGSDWRGARGEKWRAHLPRMEAMLGAVDGPLIDALCLDAPYRIADIGSGGGGTALAIFRSAPAGSVVHGLDLSPALVEAAQGRVPPGEQGISFRVADVASARAPEPPYERMVSRFGVMFFEEPETAFVQLQRWLAPRGRFSFATWADPEENPWFTIVRDAVAEVVTIPSSDPDAPGPFRYADAEKLVTLLRRAGFAELEVQDFRTALPMGGGLPAAGAAEFALTSFSAFEELLNAAGDAARRRVRDSLIASFSRHEKAGVVLLDACVHLFAGTCR